MPHVQVCNVERLRASSVDKSSNTRYSHFDALNGEANVRYPFFDIIAKAGLQQRALARLMNQDESVVTRVKNGRARPTYQFMDGAVRALREIGLRKADGRFFTVDDLFFPPLSNALSESCDTVTPEMVAL
jgi:hypothetical protein